MLFWEPVPHVRYFLHSETHAYGRIAMHFYNYYVFLLDHEANALRIQSRPVRLKIGRVSSEITRDLFFDVPRFLWQRPSIRAPINGLAVEPPHELALSLIHKSAPKGPCHRSPGQRPSLYLTSFQHPMVPRQAGGFPAISRWLRELARQRVTRKCDSGAGVRASPPDRNRRIHHPGGMAATPRGWHPSGMQLTFLTITGGVATLNHRLRAIIPPGYGRPCPKRCEV